MGKTTAVLLVIAIISLAECSFFSDFNEDKEDFKQLMRILQKPRKLTRFKVQPNEVARLGPLGFSWSSCGSSSDLATVSNLRLGPDPLKIPGNLSLAVSATLRQSVAAPLTLDLKIKKKVFIWVDIPCVDNVGSCNYPDVCSMIPSGDCPPVFKKYGIPCQCPIKAGKYALPQTMIPIPDISIPSFLEDGDYKIEARLSAAGKQITCLSMEVSLAKGIEEN